MANRVEADLYLGSHQQVLGYKGVNDGEEGGCVAVLTFNKGNGKPPPAGSSRRDKRISAGTAISGFCWNSL
jgi:hypothetical protein